MNSTKPIKLALDIHGGDFGPGITIAAACDAVQRRNDLEIILVGHDKLNHAQLAMIDSSQRARISMVHAPLELESGVGPVAAIRQGNKSSLGRAIELVASGEADACVSAGSTTALMTLGIKFIGMLEGIKRPALMARIPSATGFTSMLDLGANLNVDAVGLVQFAIMGSVSRGTQSELGPGIGLLNVGHEDSKGHSVVKEAHERLKELPLNYQGFVEGNDIFSGKVDVAVCDGFSGNLILKSGEELARMLLREVRKGLDHNWRTRLGALLVKPGLRTALARFEPAQHNGAPLLGQEHVVVKSHGSADRAGTLQAILEAGDNAARKVPGRIQTLIRQYEAETEQ
jgi:glycerol-3-phosphate acyltransferase PlsX